MILLIAAIAISDPPASAFPERTPELMEQCLLEAVETKSVTVTADSHKYICSGTPAELLWQYLEEAKLESWEQDQGSDGRWLSRAFPLGGCFKRTRMADGSRATNGLSCTVWIPRIAK